MIVLSKPDTHNAGNNHDNPETHQQLIIAALDMKITAMCTHGMRHQFLPQVEKENFAMPLDDIISNSGNQNRVWHGLGNRYLENYNKRMQNKQAAARMQEWLVPVSSKQRQQVRNRTLKF